MNEEYASQRIAQYRDMKPKYEEFAVTVLDILKMIIKEDYPDLKIASFASRAKDIESLRKKLLKDKYTKDSEITDLAGVRVITYSRKDIGVIEKIIEENLHVDSANSINKTLGLGSDKVGYRGSHYVVSLGEARNGIHEYKKYKDLKCEIQVTSLIAHTWSEITHEKGYKFEGELPLEIERRKNLLAGMLELADMEMDAYVESFDAYVDKLQEELEEGCLKYPINSMALTRYMAWKFPNISPQIFRDIDLILRELGKFGLNSIEELNNLISPDFADEINRAEWRSLDGIIRNVLILADADKYFNTAWNPSMNQMNRKNYELYKKFGIDIDRICGDKRICII